MKTPHPLDALLQKQVPTVMVPRFEFFTPLAHDGHRFLAASDGLWIEVRRPWLHLIWPLAQQTQVAMPYGALQPVVEHKIKLPRHLFLRFAEEARVHLPNEHAAWVTCLEDGTVAYRDVGVNTATPSRHVYKMPELGEGEHPFIDLHSHGVEKAFFSPKDNESDLGEYKIAAVLGHCDQMTPQLKLRLCVGGIFIPLFSGLLDMETSHAEPHRASAIV